MPDSNDYWPANIADSNLVTPITILKEQAALLGEKMAAVSADVGVSRSGI